MFAEAMKPLVLSAVSAVMAEARSKLHVASREEEPVVAEQCGEWATQWDTLGKAFLFPAFFSKTDIEDLWEFIAENEDFLSMYMSASTQFTFRLTRVRPMDKLPTLINQLKEQLAETLVAFYPVKAGGRDDSPLRVETGLETRCFKAAEWMQVMNANPWIVFAICVYLSAVETAEWVHIATIAPYQGPIPIEE